MVFETTDPDNDDNGPGNYAYPTSGNFQAGAFDLQAFQVYDDGTNIIFRVQTRDLTPTFGSPQGAQLVDVYVHDPARRHDLDRGVVPAAQLPDRAGSAWNRLIEVQGFGQRYIDASGATLGTVQICANQISRFITFSVPKATLGTPVRLGVHGRAHRAGRVQPRPGRGFAPTPQEFQFGVCADGEQRPALHGRPRHRPEGDGRPHPAGVSQSDELDYTLHSPVTIQGVTIP